jgi:hypothetical protein
MKPTSSVHCYRWMLAEKRLTRLFRATNPESPRETFSLGERTLSRNLENKYFPRHKTRS